METMEATSEQVNSQRVAIWNDLDGFVWMRVGGPGESWRQGEQCGPYDSMAEAREDLAEILAVEVER